MCQVYLDGSFIIQQLLMKCYFSVGAWGKVVDYTDKSSALTKKKME